jgi:hypothetical protein
MIIDNTKYFFLQGNPYATRYIELFGAKLVQNLSEVPEPPFYTVSRVFK